MRNRAKCAKCHTIIESYHSSDSQECDCKEIGVHGGTAMRCSAKSWNNFLRVDDDGRESKVTVVVTDKVTDTGKVTDKVTTTPRIQEIRREIAHLRESIASTPPITPLNHYDYLTVLLLLEEIAKVVEVESEDGIAD